MTALRILLINQSFVPDRGGSGQLLGDLVEALRAKGAEITVVTAPPTYTDEDLQWVRREVRPGLEVRRVGPARFRGRKSITNRLAGYLGFMWAAFWEVDRLTRERQFDVITTASNPPVVGALGAWYSGRRHIPFVYMLHDLHPDSLLSMGNFTLPAWAVRTWKSLNRYVFDRARLIVAVGPVMKERLVRKNVPSTKVKVIHQWAHPEFSPVPGALEARHRLGIAERDMVVLYFGNMGPAHNLDWLLTAVESLDSDSVTLVFIGDGVKRADLERQAREARLPRVHFLPYQTGEAFLQVAALADLGVVTLKPGLEGLGVPSKTYSILALGRPVLAIMPRQADVARLVEEYQCGWVADSPEEIREVLHLANRDRNKLAEYGRNARRAYEEHFSLARAVDEYWEVFTEACGKAQEGGSPL
jgi:glycosyltransferase involved in cell wall biosynthesis